MKKIVLITLLLGCDNSSRIGAPVTPPKPPVQKNDVKEKIDNLTPPPAPVAPQALKRGPLDGSQLFVERVSVGKVRIGQNIIGRLTFGADGQADYVEYEACPAEDISKCHRGRSAFNEVFLPDFEQGLVQVKARGCANEDRVMDPSRQCGEWNLVDFQQPKNVNLKITALLGERSDKVKQIRDYAHRTRELVQRFEEGVERCLSQGYREVDSLKVVFEQYRVAGHELVAKSMEGLGSGSSEEILAILESDAKEKNLGDATLDPEGARYSRQGRIDPSSTDMDTGPRVLGQSTAAQQVTPQTTQQVEEKPAQSEEASQESQESQWKEAAKEAASEFAVDAAKEAAKDFVGDIFGSGDSEGGEEGASLFLMANLPFQPLTREQHLALQAVDRKYSLSQGTGGASLIPSVDLRQIGWVVYQNANRFIDANQEQVAKNLAADAAEGGFEQGLNLIGKGAAAKKIANALTKAAKKKKRAATIQSLKGGLDGMMQVVNGAFLALFLVEFAEIMKNLLRTVHPGCNLKRSVSAEFDTIRDEINTLRARVFEIDEIIKSGFYRQ